MDRKVFGLLSCALVAFASQSMARGKIDARVHAALSKHPMGLSDARFAKTGRFPVYVRFGASAAPVRPSEIAAVEWQNGAKPLRSGAYLARIDAAGLAKLEADPRVTRIDSGLEVDELLLDVAADEVGVTSLRRASLAFDGVRLDGTGRRIADIDQDAFVFHPGLFHADAGAYAWLDTNHDGQFVPGIDAIDLDGDGLASPTERAAGLIVDKVDALSKPFETHTEFRPAEDFIFLDLNGNGTRDYAEGFDETTPAYGEPVFVADDANENGVLEPSERVLRLGTSIFERIRDADGNEFVRGASEQGIIDYGRALISDPVRLKSARHGTMMNGILAGGPFPSHRFAGIAPGANILLGTGKARAESIAWALQFAPDAISMPFSMNVFSPLDGSSELEQLVDSAMQAGSIPVTSAGNSASSELHAAMTFPVGSSTLGLSSIIASQQLVLSVLFRRSVESLSLSVTLPDGTIVDMPAESTTSPLSIGPDRYLTYVDDVSSRGTYQRHIQLWSPKSFPIGTYTLNAMLSDAKPLDVNVYSTNDYRLGFTFKEHVTKSSTIGSPTTADHALTVAGYGLDSGSTVGNENGVGDLASFSSRGPRIDGFHAIDLTAPVNPLSTDFDATREKSVLFGVWAGTSCSAPIVAGGIALLRQIYPNESAESIRERILSTARHDSFVTNDVDAWGQGKLDVAAAAGIALPVGTPPSVRIEVPPEIGRGEKLVARVIVKGEAAAAQHRARWDVGYDGSYDTGWLDTDEQLIPTTSLGAIALRVETHDAQGYIAGATALVNVVEATSPPSPPSGSKRSEDSNASSCAAARAGLPEHSSLPAWLLIAGFCFLGFIRPRRRQKDADGSDDGPSVPTLPAARLYRHKSKSVRPRQCSTT